MTPSSLQAGIGAAIAQIVALVVGFGILDSSLQGVVVSAAVAVVNVAFLIGNAEHAKAAAIKAAGK